MWREHLRLNGMLKEDEDGTENEENSEIVMRGGKRYRKVDPRNAAWIR
jgi:hypothetical protein